MTRRLKDQCSTDDLVALIALADAALNSMIARNMVKRELRADDKVMAAYKEVVDRLHTEVYLIGQPELRRQAEEELQQAAHQPHVIVDLNKHLEPYDFLVVLELARIVLGSKSKRDYWLEAMDVCDEDADKIYQRLCRLMSDVRANERKIPNAQDPARLTGFPALESGSDENSE